MNFDQANLQQITKTLFVTLVVGVFLGIVGAFGTQEVAIFRRVSFFVAVSIAGNLTAILVTWVLDKFINDQDRPILYNSISLILITIPTAYLVIVISGLFFEISVSWANYVRFLPSVFLVSGFFTILHALVERAPVQTHALKESKESPKLIYRLPIKYRNATIFAIKSEDHYLRIYTSMGDELILYRFSDALQDLEGIEGVQTHRSWWVAIDAIEKLEKNYGKNSYKLKNEIIVPISRTYSKALKNLELL